MMYQRSDEKYQTKLISSIFQDSTSEIIVSIISIVIPNINILVHTVIHQLSASILTTIVYILSR